MKPLLRVQIDLFASPTQPPELIGSERQKAVALLRALLIEAAHAAARTKGTYLAAQYRRLAARRGKAKAAVAVGHSILRIAYYLLRRETTYQERGANYFDERDRQRVERQLVRRLEQLGHKVTLEPAAPAHPAA